MRVFRYEREIWDRIYLTSMPRKHIEISTARFVNSIYFYLCIYDFHSYAFYYAFYSSTVSPEFIRFFKQNWHSVYKDRGYSSNLNINICLLLPKYRIFRYSLIPKLHNVLVQKVK
jgi:hypothetical protein